MKLDINQLADAVNKQLSDNVISDGRQKSTVSERRIRDYISKGLLRKPIGSGKEKHFNESHVEELLALRQLQQSGITEKYIIDNSLENKNESQLLYKSQEQVGNPEALDLLSSLSNLRNISTQSIGITSNYRTSNPEPPKVDSGHFPKSQISGLSPRFISQSALNTTTPVVSYIPTPKSYSEYEILPSHSVVLKIDNSLDLELKNKITQAVISAIQSINLK